jgi:hypothetical protein
MLESGVGKLSVQLALLLVQQLSLTPQIFLPHMGVVGPWSPFAQEHRIAFEEFEVSRRDVQFLASTFLRWLSPEKDLLSQTAR